MGQKESHLNHEDAKEYAKKRHSFYERPEEMKAMGGDNPTGQYKHKRSRSKDLSSLKSHGNKSKPTRNEDVSVSIIRGL